MTIDLLQHVLADPPEGFALLHRPDGDRPERLEILVGDVSHVERIEDIPLPAPSASGRSRHDVVAVLPYRQIRERGFACPDDGAPLLVIEVDHSADLPLDVAMWQLPDTAIDVRNVRFDVDDDEYAATVRRVIADEIGAGEGANFVVKRSLLAELADYRLDQALSFFRRLLALESGAYWTFLIHTGDRTFVGASPERHVSLKDGVAVMNPISGTYRYPPSGPDLSQVMSFLADEKETDELYMVVDEELKMMARVCDEGGRVVGPYLREMARLAHTEYFITGPSSSDPSHVLRETMFAPTVTGSPLESACRVIARYEPEGRGYYSGVAAVIGTDDDGRHTLDSCILIRTADIDAAGHVDIGVGATLVRHSDPSSEVAETRAKAAGLLAALRSGPPSGVGGHPQVQAALARRNEPLAPFWLAGAAPPELADPDLAGREVLVVDAEDTFTSMIAHQLRATGLSVRTRRYDEAYDLDDYGFVVLGPGPGDPRDLAHPKIARLRADIDALLSARRPFLAVCLSHQVLSARLGFPIRRRPVPNQGVRKEIDLFGRRVRVGFYNSFAAACPHDVVHCPGVGPVEVSREPDTGEVHALRGPQFASAQFHAESVLTHDGIGILRELVKGALMATQPDARALNDGVPSRVAEKGVTDESHHRLVGSR